MWRCLCLCRAGDFVSSPGSWSRLPTSSLIRLSTAAGHSPSPIIESERSMQCSKLGLFFYPTKVRERREGQGKKCLLPVDFPISSHPFPELPSCPFRPFLGVGADSGDPTLCIWVTRPGYYFVSRGTSVVGRDVRRGMADLGSTRHPKICTSI